MVNVPYNCTESELQAWVESCGVGVKSVRLIRDLVAGVSPAFAYVEIPDGSVLTDAIATLDGKHIRDRVIKVNQASRRMTAA